MPAAGFAIDLLPGRGLERSASPAALGRNLRTAYDTVVAFARAFALVGRLRPRVVVGVGGYASLPALVAAARPADPGVVHEPTPIPASPTGSRCASGARAAVSLPGTPLPGAVVTGNPVRPAIAAVERAPVAPPLVAVVGGSLGARSLNQAALGLYDRWRDRTDVTVHHVTGARDYEECSTTLAAQRAAGDALSYSLVPFEEHMEVLYAEATLVVCRAGGMTAELTAVGMPSVLVPLPGAPGDHQTAQRRRARGGRRRGHGRRRRARPRAPRHRGRRAARRPGAARRDGRGRAHAGPARRRRPLRRLVEASMSKAVERRRSTGQRR